MSSNNIRLGRESEKKAIQFLKRNGYKILAKNYRTPFGEIDIIAKEGGYIVFLEVKSLKSPLFGPPYLKVTKEKKRHIIKSALFYLKMHASIDAKSRIDIVSLNLSKGHLVELIKDAINIKRWSYDASKS